MSKHAHTLDCLEEGPRGLSCKVTGEGNGGETAIRGRIRAVVESVGYFSSSPLDLGAVAEVRRQLTSGVPTRQIMAPDEPYSRLLRIWQQRQESLKQAEPTFARSVHRAQRLERESVRKGKTFGSSPYRLSVYVDSVWRGVEPTGDVGHFGFYSTEAEAEQAAQLYKQRHGTPRMMSLVKRVSAKRDLPVWDEFGGERRVAAEVVARVGKPARPKTPAYPPGTEHLVIEREPLDSGGYARSGRYFGTGEKLWAVTDEEGRSYWYVRAPSKADARRVALDPKWGRS